MIGEFHPQPKGQTRLTDRVAKTRASARFDREFRAEVWQRDQGRCRKCGRTVKHTMARVPDRGEVNHCHGRIGKLRYEDRCALLLCLADHALGFVVALDGVNGVCGQGRFGYRCIPLRPRLTGF